MRRQGSSGVLHDQLKPKWSPQWSEACSAASLTLLFLPASNFFHSQVDEAAVWSELGHAQLRAGNVADAIASYLKAADSSNYLQVRLLYCRCGCLYCECGSTAGPHAGWLPIASTWEAAGADQHPHTQPSSP